jgi:hypothetical protein
MYRWEMRLHRLALRSHLFGTEPLWCCYLMLQPSEEFSLPLRDAFTSHSSATTSLWNWSSLMLLSDVPACWQVQCAIERCVHIVFLCDHISSDPSFSDAATWWSSLLRSSVYHWESVPWLAGHLNGVCRRRCCYLMLQPTEKSSVLLGERK